MIWASPFPFELPPSFAEVLLFLLLCVLDGKDITRAEVLKESSAND